MEQVVRNLLLNATKFACKCPIDVTLSEEGGRIRLKVVDRGIGVRPAERDRIFDRYARSAPARHYAGMGLGLWVTRQVVEAHDGTIAVEDTPGGGATFVVEFPETEEEAMEKRSAQG